MFKVKRIAVAAGICTLLLSPAMAGQKYVDEVYITASYFSGALGSARASSDSLQYIGCFTADGGGGICYARDSAGTAKMCAFGTNFLRTVESINPASSLYAAFGRTGSSCTAIHVVNMSWYRPMTP